MNQKNEHRDQLFILLCSMAEQNGQVVWKSKVHTDGRFIKGGFILAIGETLDEQIGYYLPSYLWRFTTFAKTLKQSIWIGGDAKEVLTKLKKIVKDVA